MKTTRTWAEERALQKQGEETRDKYDYLDSIPIPAWIWEFLRRSEGYRNSYLALKESVTQGIDADSLRRQFMDFKREARQNGLLILFGKIRASEDNYLDGYLQVRLPLNEHFEQIFKVLLRTDDVDEYGYVPDPDRRFIDFHIKPSVIGLFPPKPRSIITFDDEGSFDVKHRDLPPQRSSGKPLITVHESIKDIIIEKILKKQGSFTEDPLKPEDEEKIMRQALNGDEDEETIYVALSRSAKHEDLKKHLLSEIKNYLIPDKPRTHNSKWKHYLIAFDLKEKSGDKITYASISNLLIEAYPRSEIRTKKDKPTELKVPFDAKNIENFHKTASNLIAGGYKKYLL